MEVRDIHRKRLPREERERVILDEAVRFFAEVGFEGQTRALAERLGVTQPLLYRYFPDKDTLIERVFDEVYLKRWHPEWERLLRDRTIPLPDRVVLFYKDYCREIFRSDFVRIFMFAGLKGESINKRYLDIVHANILEPLCIEIRHDVGLPPPDVVPVDDMEINVAWALHGSMFHIATRKWIHKLPSPDDSDHVIEQTARAFFEGGGATIKRQVTARVADKACGVGEATG